MKPSKAKIVFALFAALSVQLFGYEIPGERYDSLVTEGIRQIYNIEFDKAEETFSVLRVEYPKRPAGVFFDAMIIWWKIMLDFDNLSYDEIFLEKLEKTIDFCDELLDENDENADALFFKGGALGFRGRLYSVRKNWFEAALDGKEALPLVYEAYELNPANDDVQLGFGIYNYYAAVIPEQYPFVKPFMILFPSGDRDRGLEQLQRAAESGKYSKYESRYFLLHLYFHFEKNYREGLKYAEWLISDFPDNPTFQRYLGRCYIGLGDYVAAYPIFGSIMKKCAKGMPGYTQWIEREAAYYIGMYHKNGGETDSALVFFEICEDLSRRLDKEKEEDSGFLINSLLFQGIIKYDKGELETSRRIFEELLEMRDYNESRETAASYIKKINAPKSKSSR